MNHKKPFFILLLSGACAGVTAETTRRHNGSKEQHKDQSQMKSRLNKNRTPPLGETHEWGDK